MARPQTEAAAGVPSAFHTRAMHPVRNPVYAYNYNDDFKRQSAPPHALDVPMRPTGPPGTDPRRTAKGDKPRITGPSPTGQPIQPMAYQTPTNVWELYPA